MSDVFLIPFGSRLIALDRDQLQRGLDRAAQLVPMSMTSINSMTTTSITPDEPLLNAREAAALLRLPESTLYRQAKSGRVPALRVGRFYRFRRSTLLAAVATGSLTVGRS